MNGRIKLWFYVGRISVKSYTTFSMESNYYSRIYDYNSPPDFLLNKYYNIFMLKVCDKLQNKIGRPKTDKPKSNFVACRLTDEELLKLQQYCKIHNVSQTQAIRDGIFKIIQEG